MSYDRDTIGRGRHQPTSHEWEMYVESRTVRGISVLTVNLELNDGQGGGGTLGKFNPLQSMTVMAVRPGFIAMMGGILRDVDHIYCSHRDGTATDGIVLTAGASYEGDFYLLFVDREPVDLVAVHRLGRIERNCALGSFQFARS